MDILTGANVNVRYDQDYNLFVVVINVGPTYTEYVDQDPVKALGVACLLQAGFTPGNLKNRLIHDQAKHEDKL